MDISLYDRLRRGGAAFQAVAVLIRAHPVTARWLLAGPGALAAAVVTTMAMPVWMPAGAAGINDIAWPLVLVPLLWAAPFFYACLEEDLARGVVVMLAAILCQGPLVASAMAG